MRQVRKKMGLTQLEFAMKLGYGHGQFVSNAERGESEIPHKKLMKILSVEDQARYIHCKIRDLKEKMVA